MKKLLLLFTIASLSFHSCSKDETLEAKRSLIGIWSVVEANNPLFWKFTEDNKILSASHTYTSFNVNKGPFREYSVKGNEITIIRNITDIFSNIEYKGTIIYDIEFLGEDHVKFNGKKSTLETEGEDPQVGNQPPPTFTLKRVHVYE